MQQPKLCFLLFSLAVSFISGCTADKYQVFPDKSVTGYVFAYECSDALVGFEGRSLSLPKNIFRHIYNVLENPVEGGDKKILAAFVTLRRFMQYKASLLGLKFMEASMCHLSNDAPPFFEIVRRGYLESVHHGLASSFYKESWFSPKFHDEEGNNILHYAVMSENVAMVEAVMQIAGPEGASLLVAENKAGLRPLDLGSKAMKADVAVALRTHFRIVNELQSLLEGGAPLPTQNFGVAWDDGQLPRTKGAHAAAALADGKRLDATRFKISPRSSARDGLGDLRRIVSAAPVATRSLPPLVSIQSERPGDLVLEGDHQTSGTSRVTSRMSSQNELDFSEAHEVDGDRTASRVASRLVSTNLQKPIDDDDMSSVTGKVSSFKADKAFAGGNSLPECLNNPPKSTPSVEDIKSLTQYLGAIRNQASSNQIRQLLDALEGVEGSHLEDANGADRRKLRSVWTVRHYGESQPPMGASA